VTVSVVAISVKATVRSVLALKLLDEEATEVTLSGALAAKTPLATSAKTAYS